MSEQRTEKTHPLHGLEPKQPEPKRCECGACVWEAGPMAWYWQPMQGKTLRRMHEYSHLRIYPNDCGFAHCPGECGCRLSVVDGEPRVGLSVRAVIEQLRLAHDELYEDASLYHEGGDDKGDGAFAWGKQCGYRHAIKMLGGETDGHDA